MFSNEIHYFSDGMYRTRISNKIERNYRGKQFYANSLETPGSSSFNGRNNGSRERKTVENQDYVYGKFEFQPT